MPPEWRNTGHRRMTFSSESQGYRGREAQLLERQMAIAWAGELRDPAERAQTEASKPRAASPLQEGGRQRRPPLAPEGKAIWDYLGLRSHKSAEEALVM